MKKLILFAAIATMLVSCAKEDEVKPSTPQPQVQNSQHPDFVLTNLPGTWTRYRERLQGANVHWDHFVTEMAIPVTVTSWYGYPMVYGDNVLTITYYARLGSDNTWDLNFGDPNAFTLTNVVDTGFYAGTSIIDYYKRVN